MFSPPPPLLLPLSLYHPSPSSSLTIVGYFISVALFIGQAREFIQKSRADMYRNYIRSPMMIAEQKRQKAVKEKKASSHADDRRDTQDRIRKPQMKELEKEKTTMREEGRSFRDSAKTRGYSDVDDRYEREERDKEWERQERVARARERERMSAKGREGDHMNKAFNSAAEVGSSLADAAGEAASVTGAAVVAAAGSLFSFAAKSVAAVADIGSSINTGITAPIQVGRKKVQITRELAEGGFGKVYLVKDVDSGQDYAMKLMVGNFCISLLNFTSLPKNHLYSYS